MKYGGLILGIFLGYGLSVVAEPVKFKTEEEREYLSLALRCEGQLEAEKRHAEADLAECRRRLDGERQKVQTATVVCAPVCPACDCDSTGGLVSHGLVALGGLVAGGALCAVASHGTGVVVAK